jgi:hypothetical protein
MACTTPVVEGMPVLKNTANTTSEARPQSSSSTTSTSTSMPMLPRCLSQQVNECARPNGRPASRRRLMSYSPMAMKGPTSRQPLASDMAYSGRVRNTQPKISAINQNAPP